MRTRVLLLSTLSFTLLFAVWLMLGMLSIRIKPEFNLTDSQLYTLAMAAILPGAVLRFHFGLWTDRLGGRRMMTALLLAVAVPTYFLSQATTYEELLICSLLFGLAGNSFAIGVAWNAAWFPRERQGMALGIFGAGNVGASVTKLLGPMHVAVVPTHGFLDGMIPGGWRFIPVVYAVLLVTMAMTVWVLAPHRDRTPGEKQTLAEALATLWHPRVWEYGLQYTVVFGAYVALSGVLPHYYFSHFADELSAWLNTDESSGRLAACIGIIVAVAFVFPASLLRPLGGWLSDRFGPRIVTSTVFAMMIAACAALIVPLDVVSFTAALAVLGVGMGIGKGSVYKSIPEDFPREVGAVGGMVGLLGALGGVFFPLLWSAVPDSTFAVLLGFTAVSAIWYAFSKKM